MTVGFLPYICLGRAVSDTGSASQAHPSRSQQIPPPPYPLFPERTCPDLPEEERVFRTPKLIYY